MHCEFVVRWWMKKMNSISWYHGRVTGVMISALLILTLCSGQVMAQTCNTTSITAETPTADFIANGNGTTTHTKSGLMWKRCSEGQTWNGTTCTGVASTFTWNLALQQAQTVNTASFAGFSDWRVPNLKELSSIVERQCRAPAVNISVFPATPNLVDWSATPSITNAANAWAINLSLGLRSDAFLKSGSHNLRLVRGGP